MEKKRSTRIVISLLALAMVVLALTLVTPGFPDHVTEHSAQAGPPDQPGGRRRIRFGSARRYRATRGIHRTAIFSPPPDDPFDRNHGPDPCGDVRATDDAGVWVFYPRLATDIFLEDPFHWPGIVVWLCAEPQSTDVQYKLTYEDGTQTDLNPAYPDGDTNQSPYAYVYEFEDCEENQTFPECSPSGAYRVTIEDGSGLLTDPKDYNVDVYPGPSIELGGDESLEINYLGFTGVDPLRACLYRDVDEKTTKLVNDWQVSPNDAGEYREARPITDTMDEGKYILIAVPDVAIVCPSPLDPLAVAYLAGKDIAYNEFELEPAEEDGDQPPDLPGDSYFDLQWVPGCDPTRPLALQRPSQGGCNPEVERHDLGWLTEMLRQSQPSVLAEDEWLEVVSLRRWRRQALAIRGEVGSQLGWIRVGGPWPGSVWRTTYFPPGKRVSGPCWLDTDYNWQCEN